MGVVGEADLDVRLYDPWSGRFLEVDPIEGGSCNDYDYVCGDPINGFDLGGTQLAKPSLCSVVFDFEHRKCTVEDIKEAVRAADAREAKAREAKQRANVLHAKEQRTARPRAPEPEGSMWGPTLDGLARLFVSGVWNYWNSNPAGPANPRWLNGCPRNQQPDIMGGGCQPTPMM